MSEKNLRMILVFKNKCLHLDQKPNPARGTSPYLFDMLCNKILYIIK